MATVQEEVFDNTIKDARLIGDALISKIMKKLQEEAMKKDGQMAKELLSFTDKGGKLALLNCQTFCSKEFLHEFDRNGIPYMEFMTNKSRNVSILIKNDPETIRKATAVRDAFLVKRGTYYQEVSPLAMYHACHGGNIIQLKGLTKEELHVLRDKSFHMKNGFTIASQQDGDNYTVFFHPKDSYNTETSDRTDMAEALVAMKISLHGNNDDIKEEQIKYDMDVQDKVINFDYNAGQDIYVVDMQKKIGNTSYLHISQDGMEYASRYKKEGDTYERILNSQIYEKNNPDALDAYNEEIIKSLHSMNDMRIMTAQEFEDYKSHPKKYKSLRPKKDEKQTEVAEKEKGLVSDIVKLCRQRTEQACSKIMNEPAETRDYHLFSDYMIQISKLSREDVAAAVHNNGLDGFDTDKYLDELHSISRIEKDSINTEEAAFEEMLAKYSRNTRHAEERDQEEIPPAR